MKIIVATTMVPFQSGGDAVMLDSLTEMLRQFGHTTDTVRIPFSSVPADMPAQMIGIRLIDLCDDAELLITIRTPSYLLRHPNKISWFIHHHRGAYDLWGTKYQDPQSTEEGLRLRHSLMGADEAALAECRRIFANSRVVSDRLYDFNGIKAKVLYPPLPHTDRFFCSDYGDYVVCISRIVSHKRQALAVESMRHVKSGVRLVIAGPSDDQQEANSLHSLVKHYGLEDRVEIIDHWISDEQKARLYASSLACIYIPVDEDSYGYVSLESAYSRKAIITCTDSGGTLEFVEHGINGLIVHPNSEELAMAMDELMFGKDFARQLGEAASCRPGEMNISWDHVIRELTL